MKTLWYLQASLSDLSSNPNTPNFIICRRAFNRVQSIIFSDPLLELSTQRRQVDPRVNKPMALNLTSSPVPYAPDQASTTHPNHRPAPKASHWKNIKRQTFKDLAQLKGGKISEKILPSTVGMGLALAGIALPQMSQQTGHVPIEQSRDYGQNITIDSRGRNKSVDDNSASEEDEFDQIRSPNAKQKSSSISRKRSNLLSTNPQITTRTRHQSFRASGPRSQILTPANSSSQGSPRYTSHSAHSAHASNHSFNNKQTQLMNHAEESATLAALSPDWHSSFNQAQPQSLSYSLSTPTILTAPISSPHLFPRVSSPLPNLDPHQTSPSFQSASSSSNQVSNYALPTVTRHSGQRGAGSVGVHSSRAHPAAPISQSAPSLPDALSNFKLDSRLHHSHAPTSHRNGKQSLQFTTSSPLRSLFSALSMDPSEIPTSLLNQVLQSQSMRSQLDLITNLQDIATRLVIVPKKARLSALRAELTVLNHSLPKGCCLGMYCNGDYCEESVSEANSNLLSAEAGSAIPKRNRCHQRIVRISPNESVVLNSADRAPFLIHVEVLEDHLDFDPNRRSNYEDLRKAIKGSAISLHENDPSRSSRNNTYSDLIRDSSVNYSELNVSKVSPDRRRSNTSTVDPGFHKIRSPVGGMSNPPVPLVAETLNHLGISYVGSTTTDHTPSSSSPCSDHSLSTSQIVSGNNHPSLLDRRAGFLDKRAGSALSSRGHTRRASSFDFPEIQSNFPEEEMDLVEQVYRGHEEKSDLNDPGPDDNEVDLLLYPYQSECGHDLPTRSHNKTLDEQAWKRTESSQDPGRCTPLVDQSSKVLSHEDRSDSSTAQSNSNPSFPIGQSTSQNSSTSKNLIALNKLHQSPSSVKSVGPNPSRPTLTLDEYAERMRMAAIMLAQLSASQQPPQSLTMTPSSAAGMVVGGAIGLGAGFVGVTVGAGLGAVVTRRLVGNSQTVITSPIGRKDHNGNIGGSVLNVNGSGSSGLSAPLDLNRVDGKSGQRLERGIEEAPVPSRTSSSGPNSVPRQKLLTPQQSQAIKDKIMAEMMSLEEERMQRTRLDIAFGSNGKSGEGSLTSSPTTGASHKNVNVADEEVVMKAVNEEDPSGKMLSESWEEKRNRIRSSSPYGHLANWNLFSVIVKTGTDLRQEQIITQLINEFGRIWKEEHCNVWVRYYRILVTGESTGLMETIVDAVSIHSLKKSAFSKISHHQSKARLNLNSNSNQPSGNGNVPGGLPNYSIFDHYVDTYGPPTGAKYKKAQENFMRSLVSYSIISYILQLKDRHNGNILIDKEGHIIHIDFGFVLNNSPGSIGFEMAPFKLSQDYIEVLNPPLSFHSSLDGLRHTLDHHHSNQNLNRFNDFVDLFKLSFKKIRKHAERIITIVELMQVESKLPCFGGNGEIVIKNLRDRFQLNLTSEAKLDEFIEKLILSSVNSVFTKLYDSFQYFSQGVL